MMGGDQIVVRSDDFMEFLEAIEKAKEMGKMSDEDSHISADEYTDEHLCPVHKVKMKERDGYKGAPNYWDHRKKEMIGNEEVWVKCSGKGFK